MDNAWDSEGFNVVSGNNTTEFTAAYVATLAVDCINKAFVDWLFRITALGGPPITGVDVVVQYSTLRTPNPATDDDWATVPYLDTAAGTGVQSVRLTVQSQAAPAAVPATIGVTSPVYGRWMRIKFKSTGGVPATSSTTITAFRRT